MLNTIEKGDYAYKIDLQDAYFHVLTHPDSRKYLRFAFENKVYQFRVLPFGLNSNTAPQVFTHLGHTVVACLHRDDWLIHHQSQFLNSLIMVGLKLNKAKSELEPVQDIQFLGPRLRLDQGELPSQYPRLG